MKLLVVLIVLDILFTGVLGNPINQTEEDFIADLIHLGEAIFGEPSEETGEKVKNWNESSKINPEELGDYVQGDILVPQESRNGLVGKVFRWPAGVIPYEIIGVYSPNDLWNIQSAMEEYHRKTCIRFRRRTFTDIDYLSITNTPTGCWSSVGRIGGRQEVNLQSPGCLSGIGTAIHELMHAVGFLHEQNRHERDGFVDILWENILAGREGNFFKANVSADDGFGVSYDYDSVMHYSSTAFSSNGRPTIHPKAFGAKVGQRVGFSKGDVMKINAMYRCNKPNTGGGGILDFLFGVIKGGASSALNNLG